MALIVSSMFLAFYKLRMFVTVHECWQLQRFGQLSKYVMFNVGIQKLEKKVCIFAFQRKINGNMFRSIYGKREIKTTFIF